MLLVHILLSIFFLYGNLLIAYDQNHHTTFRADLGLNLSPLAYKNPKPTIRITYSKSDYMPEPYRLPGVGAQNKNSKGSHQQAPQQLNSTQKSKIENFGKKLISETSNVYQANLDRIYPTLCQTIGQFVIDPTLQQDHVQRAVMFQVIQHLVTTHQTNHGIITRYQEHPWVQNKDFSQINEDAKVMINYMLDCMINAENNTTIELAQATLQTWIYAQNMQSFEDHKLYIDKANNYYNAMQTKTITKSIHEHAKPLYKKDITNLLNNYNDIIKDSTQNPILYVKSYQEEYLARIEKRIQALAESKEQIRKNKLAHHVYEMSINARAFLMANNLNYAAFDAITATNFQHCLTEENLGIIESSINMATFNNWQSIIAQLVYYNCSLAVSAQQLNQLAHLEQAAAVTDLNHFFQLYGRSILDDELEGKGWIALGSGIYDGTIKLLHKWNNFTKKLGHQEARKKIIQDLSRDCYQVGQLFHKILETWYDLSIFAYLDDHTKDMMDAIHPTIICDRPDLYTHKVSRTTQRQRKIEQSLEDGLSCVVATSKYVIQDMLSKTLQENTAHITEFALENFIYGKIIDTIVGVSKLGASQCFQTSSLFEKISQEMLEDSISFAQNSNGQLLAITNKAGHNISESVAAAAQTALNNSAPFFKFAQRAKTLQDKINEITKADTEKTETFKRSIEEFIRTDKIVDVEKLKSITDVEQITLYKNYTNNFHPDGIAKLKPEEILHLNLCTWLEPKARTINERIQKIGGLKIIDIRDGMQCITKIDELDLFHSLLGELKPGSISWHTKGGHLSIPDLQAALLDYGEIKSLGNGFFDMQIKYQGKISNTYKRNSYFPTGTSVEQAVEMLEEAINNTEKIKNITEAGTLNKLVYEAKCLNKQALTIRVEKLVVKRLNKQGLLVDIEKNIAQFYPLAE